MPENVQSRVGRLLCSIPAQVVLCVVIGIALGQYLHTHPNSERLSKIVPKLADFGKVIIASIKTLAVPLIFFAILDGMLRTRMTWTHGARLVTICVFNVTVAFSVGVTLVNVLRPGERMRGTIGSSAAETLPLDVPEASLSPIDNLLRMIPSSILEPFLENQVLGAVFIAILIGAALRGVLYSSTQESSGTSPAPLDSQVNTPDQGDCDRHPIPISIEALYRAFMKLLGWLVRLVPLAVLGTVASVVSKYGLEAFQGLLTFFGFIMLTLGFHALVYYPMANWLVGGKTPQAFLTAAADAVFTGLSTNSSLATVPVTLQCLTDKLKVSITSARLSTCIGTNLNNDGIMLYEAMAVLFLAQATGMNLGWSEQLIVLAASIMAGVGIAGIPEAGYVMLPLVLSVAGFSEEQIAIYWPLILPVDWVLARVRSAVNVMGDMTVAIMLDRFETDLAS